MARTQCRVWWPKQLLHGNPSSNLLLFGWCMNSFNSLDIVVAHAISAIEVSKFQLDIQEVVYHVDANMSSALQESSTFSVLGVCIVESCSEDKRKIGSQFDYSCSTSIRKKMQFHRCEQDTALNSIFRENVHDSSEDYGTYRYGFKRLDSFIDTLRQALFRHGNWIQLHYICQGSSYKGARWIPKFDHVHQNGNMLPISAFHLIIYDLPAYGVHHYSLNSWVYSAQEISLFRKPSWMDYLHRKPVLMDLEAAVLALNCSGTAKKILERRLGLNIVATNLFLSVFTSKLCYVLAIPLSSISAGIYVIIQSFYTILEFKYHKLAIMILRKVFRHTWKNVHIRSSQFLYWPIFLLGSGLSLHPNAEFVHEDALRKHPMWSSIVVDLILGTCFGLSLFANIEYISSCIFYIAHDIRDNLLRSGCVWLMGVPAGFKLNTQLSEFFGTISLDAIQTFSTLWVFVGGFLQHFIRVLALLGIFFGLTVPAALCMDMLLFVSFHVIMLHWLIAFIYSQQIQALASLWRLFRGRKWNPLRQRLDTYDDYSVEQHVVGSLLFTPLLLLLPTTSVFYIFFTLLCTSLSFLHIAIEVTISILHATPYAEILFWLMRRRRFPSGIWFEIVSSTNLSTSQSHCTITLNSDERCLSMTTESMVSILRSNYATLGQIVIPCYTRVFGTISPNFGRQLASGILSGQRIPLSLDANLPSPLPWMRISVREYWKLCYYSIIGRSLSR
ncbi:hypothetical protein HPP92_010689 [Vanilla planifolia]|uniref:Uncharacterized protein n=1 Tax=Vanilla planifolia TaxID=51239 RepID=A0A835V3Q6_VANPL|nr:hypothetical protein HPP92_010689 [Vanilla planifolia]